MTAVRPEWRQMILDGELVSTEQAALLAGVQPITIRMWVRRRHLRPVNPGGRVALYRSEDVSRAESACLRRHLAQQTTGV